MNPRLASNMPLNKIQGLYSDIQRTVRDDVPLDYFLRTAEARRKYDQNPGSFEGWSPGTLRKRRVAALGLGAYAAGDIAYRTLSGGSMYRNNTGRKDFVGIPMI